MKRFCYSMGFIVAVLAILAVACDKNDNGGGNGNPIAGTYVFTSATFNDTVHIIIQDMDVVFLPGGDGSAFVGPGLLSSAPCDDSTNAAIELKEDGVANYICLTEDHVEQMGTWSANSDQTSLILNISNPQPFSLTISDLDVTATTFTGTVSNFPLPKDASKELGAVLPGPDINYQIASVTLTFTRVP
jgi:hypothetical protein